MEKKKVVKRSIMGIVCLALGTALARILKAQPDEDYERFKRRMENYSDEELIEAFNREVGNPGWVSARAAYLAAIHDEFKKRGYDYSAIGNEKELSFAKKVKLAGKKVVPIE
jgi:hypothetical protein